MIKTARQLKDLINNLSRKNAADAQLLMRNYMMERFLERVSLSPYKDKFILKGGMLVRYGRSGCQIHHGYRRNDPRYDRRCRPSQ